MDHRVCPEKTEGPELLGKDAPLDSMPEEWGKFYQDAFI